MIRRNMIIHFKMSDFNEDPSKIRLREKLTRQVELITHAINKQIKFVPSFNRDPTRRALLEVRKISFMSSPILIPCASTCIPLNLGSIKYLYKATWYIYFREYINSLNTLSLQIIDRDKKLFLFSVENFDKVMRVC